MSRCLFPAAFAMIATVAFAVEAVLPGNYAFTIKYQSGQHRDCEQLNGSAEAVVQNGSVKSSLVRSLRLTLEPNGTVTGFGYESMTGHGAAMHLEGKQTATGFAGTIGLERWGYLCSASWNLVRPGAIPTKPAP